MIALLVHTHRQHTRALFAIFPCQKGPETRPRRRKIAGLVRPVLAEHSVNAQHQRARLLDGSALVGASLQGDRGRQRAEVASSQASVWPSSTWSHFLRMLINMSTEGGQVGGGHLAFLPAPPDKGAFECPVRPAGGPRAGQASLMWRERSSLVRRSFDASQDVCGPFVIAALRMLFTLHYVSGRHSGVRARACV